MAADYYRALGVPRQASQKEIQSAFRRLARRYHPDVNPGDPEAERRFKEISEAHDVLSDPAKRRLYDRFGDGWRSAAAAGIDPDAPYARAGSAGGRGFDPQDLEGMLRSFGQRFGGRGRSFTDLFESVFGRHQGEGEVQRTIEIGLAEAARGTTRVVTLPDGRRLELQIPAGVEDGMVLRVPGLRARVHVRADGFRREGKDLTVQVPVPLRTALLGGEVEVRTVDGRVQLRVPPQTQNGTRLRLRGLGLPDPRGGKPGDLYAEVSVRLPLPLDEHARRWAESLPAS
jgi:curved DNA-binding protein